MVGFQFLLIIAVIGVALLALRSLRSDRALAMKRLLALLFVVAAVVAISVPSLLTDIAHMFGVGRGTDFLLYIFIVIGMLFAVAVIRAKARSDARVTRLARAVALIDARERELREQNKKPKTNKASASSPTPAATSAAHPTPSATDQTPDQSSVQHTDRPTDRDTPGPTA
jgi:hypothetical protein